MSREILGLDIRQHALSAVLLKSGLKGNRIESHLHILIADGIDNGLAQALDTVRSQIKIGGASCIAAYPAQWLFYRNLRVPFKDRRKIRQIINFELESSLPYPADEVVIDFHIIASTPEYSDILAIIAEKTRLKSYLDILSAAHIKPQMVTAGGYCTALSLNRVKDIPKNWILADIEPSGASLFVCADGQVCFARSFPLSSSDDLSSVKVIGIQTERSLSGIEDIREEEFRPEAVFISGQEISPEIRSEFEERFGLSPKQADVLDNELLRQQGVQNWESYHNDHALALAIAESEGFNDINLRQGAFAAINFWAEHKNGLVQSAALIAVILIFALSSLMIDTYSMEKKADALNAQINGIFSEAFPEIKKITDPLAQMKSAIQEKKKEALLSGETVKNIRVIDIINEISKNIPKQTDMDLTQVVVGQEGVSIGGDTGAFNVVDDVRSRLEKVAMFKKVTIVSTKTDRSGNRVLFKMNIEL